MTTEAELLREQIKELYLERKAQEQEQETATVEQAAPAAEEPLEVADLALWLAIVFAVLLGVVWFSVWALVRGLRALVRTTSEAWHEGASRNQ